MYARNDAWAIKASFTATGETAINVYASQMSPVREISNELVISGLSLVCVRAGGGIVVTPSIYSTPSGQPNNPIRHRLDTWTTVLATEARVWTGLAIPVTLDESVADTQRVLKLIVATNALDVYEVTLWGTFRPDPVPYVDPEPQLVTLDGVKSIFRRV